MDIHSVRQQLRTKSIYDIPLRVTYYARVSSETDEQRNSLDNQIVYYENLIRKNSLWRFVPGYIDEGLSGISTRKREHFNRMVLDASEDKFDLILTKEISRFARNTLDSIRFTRQLLDCGVGVFFQNDNINTLDEDSELRLSIMSSIAQDELRKLSSRVKFGHQQAIKSSVVLGNSRIFGYRKEHKRLVIDEEQAVMVRELFQRYATDQYSMKQLETLFWERGYRNYNGKKIAHNTLSGILSNPKYKGYYVGNKVKVVDMFTKKQKFLPPDQWVMFKDETGQIVPAIVSEELWDRANAVLKRRSEDVKARQGICNHPNLLTGKLICTHCGRTYHRKESRDKNGTVNSKWVCAGKISNGAASCPSFALYERELKPVLFQAFTDTEVNVEALMEEYAARYRALDRGGGLEREMEELRRRMELTERKKSKLLEYNVTGQLSDQDFLSLNRQCARELESAQAALEELEEQELSRGEFRRHMERIRSVLEQARKEAAAGMITREFVNRYIDKIYVTPEGERTARLDIRIFTGESTQSYLEKLRGRRKSDPNPALPSGHTFKKMIEAYENGLK